MKTLRVLAFALVLRAGAWVPKPPLGLDLYLPAPVSNPLTRESVALGRRLFFDKRLSRDGTIACVSCHDPARAFSDGRTVARGIHDTEGTRNAPALINRGYGRLFFWDGRADSLERQAMQPILNPIEMGLTEAEIEHRTGMKLVDVTAALASYVRTIRSGDSRFDRYAAGRVDSLNALEKSGLQLFRGKGGCSACHIGPNFTDENFHNTGVAWRDGRFADEGRFTVSGNPHDHGAFKTPTLREVSRTAPYMHDGSLTTVPTKNPIGIALIELTPVVIYAQRPCFRSSIQCSARSASGFATMPKSNWKSSRCAINSSSSTARIRSQN